MVGNPPKPYDLLLGVDSTKPIKWNELFDTWASRARAEIHWRPTDTNSNLESRWEVEVLINGRLVQDIIGKGRTLPLAKANAVEQINTNGSILTLPLA
ncbi:hypothetical protein BDV93DRAFT_567216 [Ceratobasidium sp. AG-I]|nr:hypothetical protein BDV93DRAFT_567216 [Ceratobasidium sp. AG-I]